MVTYHVVACGRSFQKGLKRKKEKKYRAEERV